MGDVPGDYYNWNMMLKSSLFALAINVYGVVGMTLRLWELIE